MNDIEHTAERAVAAVILFGDLNTAADIRKAAKAIARNVLTEVEPLIRADEHEQVVGVAAKMLDDLRVKIEAMFAENLPPYLFRHNEDALFPKMERTLLNDAIRDVWNQAKENVLVLFDGGSDA